MTDRTHTWRFFRAGGFDQVRLDSADDLLALPALDQKLWVALACPTRGIEFDARTLDLIDSDGDGRIRAPELLAAIDWAVARLARPEVLGEGLAGVPVDALADGEIGGPLAAAARTLAATLGKGSGDVIGVEDASTAEALCRERLNAAWEAAVSEVRVAGEGT
ncbi:MAG TPA: hypothetical protein PLN96_17455, partial [Zoogloea sp.]|nr:hypothetical protein [Zoogloea sp.]